jgi:HEAT repeat protein
MRFLILGCALMATACQGPDKKEEDRTSKAVHNDVALDQPELFGDEASRLLRSTEKNVRQYRELLLQGQTRAAVAMRKTVGDTVDREFPTFERIATEGELLIQRNQAVKCLGFARLMRKPAREVLVGLFEDREPVIVSNAVLGLGILRDPATDLTPIVALLAHPDLEVRTNAASALKELFLIKETPRELNAQYITALDRLVGLLHEKRAVRARRAAAGAIANMHHPATLDHLVSALSDSDEMVQIGGLHGIELLGDQRAIEPLLEYLRSGPTREGESWARKALVKIAVQGGFAKTESELDALGTSPREWENWFRAARNR